MTSSPIEALTLPFDATNAQQKTARRRRRMRSRLVSLVITVAVLVAIYLWQQSKQPGTGFAVLSGAVLAVSLGWFVVSLVGYLQAKKELTSVGSGIALRIGRPGVEMNGVYAPWPEVLSLAAVKGSIGRGPRLQLTRTQGPPVSVPFDQLGARPATLDLTARAYSGGRHGVDLEALDS